MCSDTTALPSRQSTLSMIFVHNQTFYKSWAFFRSIAVSPPDSSAFFFTGFGGLQHCTTDRADLGQLFRSQPSSTRPPFSQPDDVFTP